MLRRITRPSVAAPAARRPRAHLAGLVLVSALVAAACGGGNDEEAAPTTTSSTASTTTAAPAPVGAPLTGLPPDPAAATRPALLVKVDNAPKGRPQAGINTADVVVEEQVEGGVTRLAVLFHSNASGDVGPVRSFRTTDLHLLAQLNRPLLAYSGANRDFEAMARQANVVNVSQNAVPGAYRRVRGRPAPYNLFADVGALYARAEQGAGPPPPMFTYRAAGQPAPGEASAGVTLAFVGRVRTDVTWTWDGGSGTWRRVQNGTEHVDATGAPVAPRNVVVQFVEYIDTGYRDQSGEPVPEAKLVGEGDVWVFTDGEVVTGRWQKPDDATPTRYLDAEGQPIGLTPGQTWLELPKPGMAQRR